MLCPFAPFSEDKQLGPESCVQEVAFELALMERRDARGGRDGSGRLVSAVGGQSCPQIVA